MDYWTASDVKKAQLELLTLEYQNASQRYNNIYQSAWTIFSYMSAVSAAILAFGGEHITAWALGFTTPLPLLFWFWSTYLPLDRYGNKTLVVLSKIEERAEDDFGAPLGHFSQFANEIDQNDHGLIAQFWKHGGTFRFWKPTFWRTATWEATKKVAKRARFAICVSFVALHGFWLATIWYFGRTGFIFLKP